MNANNTTKFTFETEFAADGTILRDGDTFRLSFTREEMQAERDKAFLEGKRDALVKAEEETAAGLRQFTDRAAEILSTLQTQSNECRSQAIELVLVAAHKIADTALERYPDEQVLNTVRDVLKDLRDVPRLVITCPAGVSEKLEKHLSDIADQSDFDGALIVRRTEDAAPGDVRIEWAQGEVCITTVGIADKVESTVRNWLAATEEQDAQRDLFDTKTNSEERV